MEKEIQISRLLDFINDADESQLNDFADSQNKKGLGETLARAIKKKQAEMFGARFSSLEELTSIKGLGVGKIEAMLLAIKKMGINYHVKSRTVFSFYGDPPKLEKFEDVIKFEAFNYASSPEGNEKAYHLYYDRSLDKEKLFSIIKNTGNFKTSWLDESFAIQGKDGKFLSANPFTSVVSFVPTFGTQKHEYFKIHLFGNIHELQDPNDGTPQQDVQKYSFSSSSIQCMSDPNLNSPTHFNSLYVDYSDPDRKVKYGSSTNLPQFPRFFDNFGMFAPPIWINGPNPYRSFTLLTYLANIIPSPDTRVFLSQEGSELKAKIGNNLGWTAKNWFRYVDVVEDISIQAVWNNGSYANRLLTVSSTLTFSPPSSQLPVPTNNQKFDMFCFYGRWGERKQIAAKVSFRSKTTGRFLSVDQNDHVSCSSLILGVNETFLVENGWGTTPEDVVLKTAHGKYLSHYQGSVSADSCAPVIHEIMKILIP